MTEHSLELPALDAQNPLGFFAALGLLRVLHEDAKARHLPPPTVAFAAGGVPTARFGTSATLDAITEIVLRDAQAQASSVALSLAYDEAGGRCDASAPGATRDLKPAPDAAKAFLREAATQPRRDADLAAGLFSELVQDNNGNTKPTALHFTAGQQTFLAMVEGLRLGITAADVEEALVGPWRTASPLPSLGWDASVARNYALRASNPSKEKRGSVPAANWLAVHALAFFPVTPKGGRLRTTGAVGGWKDGSFAWPVWSAPSTVATVASLLRLDARRMSPVARAALGVDAVFECDILRTDQGGYGSFSPARVVLGRSHTNEGAASDPERASGP